MRIAAIFLSGALICFAACERGADEASTPAAVTHKRLSYAEQSTFDVLSGTGAGARITASWFTDKQTGWLATSDGSLLTSHDGGGTWRSVQMVEPEPNERITAIQVAARNNRTLYGWAATSRGRVLFTSDGANWVVRGTLGPLSSVQLVSETSAIAQGGRGLWRTDDAGNTWNQIRASLGGREPVRYEYTHFKDRLHGTAIYSDHRGWRVETTDDGGKSWATRDGSHEYDSKVFLSTIHSGGNVYVYWGTELLYGSGPPLDDMAVEKLLSRQASHRNLAHLRRTIHLLPRRMVFVVEPTWWGSSGWESLQKSDDGGNTWQRKFLTAGFKNVFFVDTNHGWAVGFGGRVSRTVDGGNSWTHTFLPTDADFRGIYFLDNMTGWIGGGKRTPNCVWRTEDGGRTWRLAAEIANGRKIKHAAPERICGIVFRDRNEGWAATHGVTIEASDDWRDNASEPREYGRILHTRDGGATWKQVYYGAPLSAIVRRNNVLVAAGYHVVRSADGVTWNDIPCPSPLFAVAFRDEAFVAACGEQSSFFFSRDQGKKWEAVKHRPPTHLDSIAFGSDKIGWMGGSFGTATHRGLFSTNDGGETWQACEVTGVHQKGIAHYWRGLSAVDENHAWACYAACIVRLRGAE